MVEKKQARDRGQAGVGHMLSKHEAGAKQALDRCQADAVQSSLQWWPIGSILDVWCHTNQSPFRLLHKTLGLHKAFELCEVAFHGDKANCKWCQHITESALCAPRTSAQNAVRSLLLILHFEHPFFISFSCIGVVFTSWVVCPGIQVDSRKQY